MRCVSDLSTRNSCVGKLILLSLIHIMTYIAYQIFPLLTSSRKAAIILWKYQSDYSFLEVIFLFGFLDTWHNYGQGIHFTQTISGFSQFSHPSVNIHLLSIYTCRCVRTKDMRWTEKWDPQGAYTVDTLRTIKNTVSLTVWTKYSKSTTEECIGSSWGLG